MRIVWAFIPESFSSSLIEYVPTFAVLGKTHNNRNCLKILQTGWIFLAAYDLRYLWETNRREDVWSESATLVKRSQRILGRLFTPHHCPGRINPGASIPAKGGVVLPIFRSIFDYKSNRSVHYSPAYLADSQKPWFFTLHQTSDSLFCCLHDQPVDRNSGNVLSNWMTPFGCTDYSENKLNGRPSARIVVGTRCHFITGFILFKIR